MKVYLVVEDYTYDFVAELKIQVFDTLEKAEKYFKEQIKQAKKDFICDYNINNEDLIVIEQEKDFTTYIDGYYCEEHTDISIMEKEIQ